MQSRLPKLLVALFVAASTLSGCVVHEYSHAERPRRCRHAVWVGSRHHGHWECERGHHVVVIR